MLSESANSICVVALLCAACASSASAQDATFVMDVFQGINSQRSKNGMKTCGYNKQLEKAAQYHAEWMARNRKMEHLEEEAATLEQHKTCNHHPIN